MIDGIIWKAGKNRACQLVVLGLGVVSVLTIVGSLQSSGARAASIRDGIAAPLLAPNSEFWVKVTDPDCPDRNATWSYSSVEDAVKDTIPGEWWPPGDYGVSQIPYSALKSAAVIIRSVIKYYEANPQNSAYAYNTAGVDWQGGQTAPETCSGVLNTELNSQRHSRSDYNSSAATDATGQYGGYQHVVDITPSSLMLVRTNFSVEKSTLLCNEQSDDYEFCALQALFGDYRDGNLATQIQCNNPATDCLRDNRYARNINTAPTSSPSGRPIVQFQAESFVERFHPRREHYWWCRTGSGFSGFTGKCFLRAEPDSGLNIYIQDATTGPYMVYHVPFPNSVRHYIWIRAWACGGPDDTVFAGLDGVLTPGAEPVITGWSGCTWQWKSQLRDGGRPYIDPAWTDTNGSYHRFYLWMKEDGIRVDQVILTQDRCWKPAGAVTPPGC